MIYKSCNLLEHGICFYNGNLCSCCYAPLKYAPYIFPYYNGEIVNIDALFLKINRWRNDAKNNHYLRSCQNCYQLETRDWADDNYIDQVYITHFYKCNANCIYCINDIKPSDKVRDTYDIIPILDNLKDKGVLKKGFELHIGGGEFTIYKESDAIIEKYVLSGFSSRIAIATNGIKFSKSIFNAMQENRACIIISLDSGNRNLYKKIKRVDCFDNVINNIKLYSSTVHSKDNTFLKYIVLPKINDNKKYFKQFLDIALDCNIKGIKIDIDGIYCRQKNYNIDEELLDFLKWSVDCSLEKGFDVETFSFYNQCFSMK